MSGGGPASSGQSRGHSRQVRNSLGPLVPPVRSFGSRSVVISSPNLSPLALLSFRPRKCRCAAAGARPLPIGGRLRPGLMLLDWGLGDGNATIGSAKAPRAARQSWL